jgi:hypothetical protein
MLQRAGIQFELVYRFWSLLVLQGQWQRTICRLVLFLPL